MFMKLCFNLKVERGTFTFFGCDAVSRIYGIGKDKITKSPKLVNICCDVAPIFYNHLSSKLDIQEAAEKLEPQIP